VIKGILVPAAFAFAFLCLQGSSIVSRDSLQESSSARSPVVQSDSSFVSVRIDERNLLSRRFEENTLRSLGGYFSARPSRWLGVEPYELTRFQCVLQGADTGITLGLIGAALGMTAGLWDEDTAWCIAGAAAALGAMQGFSKSNDPEFRIRLRWEDSK